MLAPSVLAFMLGRIHDSHTKCESDMLYFCRQQQLQRASMLAIDLAASSLQPHCHNKTREAFLVGLFDNEHHCLNNPKGYAIGSI